MNSSTHNSSKSRLSKLTSPYHQLSFVELKENAKVYSNRHMLLLQHIIQRFKYETFGFLIRLMSPLMYHSFFLLD